MKKKKAIKIAAASVLTASSFAAVAPFNSEAAVNVASVVSQATNQMIAAQNAYVGPVLKGQAVSAATVQTQVSLASKYYANAMNVINKYAGKQKSYYYSKLAAAMPAYNSAVGYIKAKTIADSVNTLATQVDNAVKANNTATVSNLLPTLNAQLSSAQASIVKYAVGPATQRVIISTLSYAKQVAANAAAFANPDTTAPVISYNGPATVNVNNGAAYTVPVLTATDNVDKTVTVNTVITDANGKVLSSIDTTVAGTYTVTYSAKDVAGNAAKNVTISVVVASATPAVTGVSAINGNQVVVKFSKAVDPTTIFQTGSTSALKANLITFGALKQADGSTPSNAVTVSNGSLSADGKTLTLSADGLGAFLGNYAVSVNAGIKTTAGEVVPAYYGNLNVNDTTAPTLVSGSASAKTSTRTITLNFSEPVTSVGAVAYINGTPATLSAGQASNQLTVTSSSDIAAGTTVDVSVLNVKDAAGNVLATNPSHTSVTVVADTATPVVSSVNVTGEKTFSVTFSKPVSATGSNFAGNVGVVTSGLNGTTTQFSVVPNSLSADGKTLSFTTISNIFANGNTFSGTLVIGKNITDAVGNAMGADYTQSISFTKDLTAPTVTSVATDSTNTHILVTFNKNISVVKALTSASQLIDANGNSVSLAGSAISVVNNQLQITKTVAPGTYTLRLESGIVTDGLTANNQNAASINSLTAVAQASTADTTKPVVTISNVVTGYNGATSAPAPEEVLSYTVQDTGSGIDINSILNLANYTVDGKALPAGSYITTSGYSASAPTGTVTVTIHIPSSSISASTTASQLVITGVKDLAGNVITPAVSSSFALAEGVAPKLSSVAVASGDNNTLVASFSATVTGLNALTVTLNGTDVTSKASLALVTAGADKGKYYVQVAESYDAATHEVYVDADNSGTLTAGDVVLATGVTTAPTATNVDFTSSSVTSLKVGLTNATGVTDAQGNTAATGTITVK